MITVGSKQFRTKTELKSYLDLHRTGTTLDTLITDPDLDSVLRALLAVHPDAARKSGAGVAGFSVRWYRTHPSHRGNPAFFVERVDGTNIDFSVLICLKFLGGRGVNEYLVDRWMRELIEPQIESFRMSLPYVVACALTGTSLTNISAYIDHAYPDTFKELTARFMVREGVDYASIPIIQDPDPMKGRMIAPDCAERWAEFHAERCALRPIDSRVNSQIGASDPADHPGIVGQFVDWVNRHRAEMADAPDEVKTRSREQILGRFAEIYRGHPELIDRVRSGHLWLANGQSARYERDEGKWFGWVVGASERQAA